MSLDPSLFLYNLTLLPPTAAVAAIVGQFLGQKHQEIIVARSPGVLELWKPDHHTGKMERVFRHNTFATIRALASFRLAGATREHIAVTSDSGHMTLLECDLKHQTFTQLRLEPYGKTGIRRLTPGEYLVADPKGRALMTAAIEKNKLVYVVNRNGDEVTISSPLEANRAKILTFALCAVDVGYENPLFAALECEYDHEPSSYSVTFYELDLGLNHVLKKFSAPVDASFNYLVSIPGGSDGPSGVLAFGKNSVQYIHPNNPTISAVLPQRDSDTYVVAAVVPKMKNEFFVLVQSQLGDLFKLTVEYADSVTALTIRYFDTIPVCKSLIVLKRGFLYAETETGAKHFYQFEKLGDEASTSPTFHPKPLDNLALVDVIEALNPITGALLKGSDIVALCGQSARSAVKKLTHGLEVSELVSSNLPEAAQRVWTTKLARVDEYDKYLVLSFAASTLVLSIGETVEEVADSGFLLTSPTLAVQQLGERALVQIHEHGIRHLKHGNLTEWFPPAGVRIAVATTTPYQIAIALSNREIVYFEIDEADNLNEYNERAEMVSSVTAMSLGDVAPGKLRSSLLAIGCDDQTLRIVSVDPTSTMEMLSVQVLASNPANLRLLALPDTEAAVSFTLYAHVGLETGVYVRTTVDELTGQLSDSRTYFLGPKPVTLSTAVVNGHVTIMAFSTRAWMGHVVGSTFKLTPLVYHALADGCAFSSEDCPLGMVGVHGTALTIFTMVNAHDDLNITSVPLRYTPRAIVEGPKSFYVIGADHGVRSPYQEGVDPETYRAFGYERKPGSWGSCLEVIDSETLETTDTVELQHNLAAFSACHCHFKLHQEAFLIVAVSQNQTLAPNSSSASFLYTYKLRDGKVEFLHSTELEAIPLAMAEFQGRLLVGMKDTLRVYEMGQKQLLRKTSSRLNVTQIVKLATQGMRVIVGDVRQSVTFCVYRPRENAFVAFADDTIARNTTAMTMLDYDTVIGGDKFGNVWVVRCPETTSRLSDDEHGLVDTAFLAGAPHRVNALCHFHLQDVPTSFSRGAMTMGGLETVVYTGIQGLVGVLAPIATKHDVAFFTKLETAMRENFESITGREHLIFRGYYVPVKGVVDGDLVEMYGVLPGSVKAKIANSLDRSVKEVERKVSEMRTRAAF
ncbi:hypothetical protein BABINDRAFT_41141 [Babjeviella inositovora NRRL Y-12698]|uniref:DNA damage-binding protein 1 n=1 Tax=Babjeviella inositovora NRRL Y-12698 TaxID=984486 RepID=A0A1E3QJR2_9ASCO|nr:uncharacterized protein BABINDRAFT_41141 [Babjeviella inositovora NRRL Y-12698]ODQ77704.1 hypothetical protein BABINDRAFT_41141 [Babjeviella inositovora NRRL Y-12698]